MIKRLLAGLAAVTLFAVLVPSSASAVTMDAAAFAAQCDAATGPGSAGGMNVTGTLNVKNGSGTIFDHCVVNLVGEGSEILFKNVTLSQPCAPLGCFFWVKGSDHDQSIRVQNSTMILSSFVVDASGSGGSGTASGGYVQIKNSTITGGGIDVTASYPEGKDGAIDVVNSDVATTSTTSPTYMHSYRAGDSSQITVKDNLLVSSQGIRITGDDLSDTTVTNNRVAWGHAPTTTPPFLGMVISGTACTSADNIPNPACYVAP